MSNTPPDFRQVAIDRLAFEEKLKWEQEQAADRARQDQINQTARYAQAQAVEAERQKLSALKAEYDKRDALAARLMPLLVEFCELENRLVYEDRSIGQRLMGLWNSYGHIGRYQELRARAGLPRAHDGLSIDRPTNSAESIASTALRGIVTHLIAEGTLSEGRFSGL